MKEFLTTDEIMTLLNIKRTALKAMIARGEFPEPSHNRGKPGQRWMARRVEKWIAAREKEAEIADRIAQRQRKMQAV